MISSVDLILSKFVDPKNDWRIKLAKEWNNIFSNGSLYQRMRLEKVQNNLVVIGVYESHWLQELYLLSNLIIESINKALDSDKVKSLKFKLVQKRVKIKTEKLQKKTFANSIKPKFTDQQKLALNSVKDEYLRQSIKSFFHRCFQGSFNAE